MHAHSTALTVRRSAAATASRPLHSHVKRGQTVVVLAAQSEQQRRPNEELLGAFFFGRAFAITLNKRFAGALVEGLSAVGSAIASRDTLVRSFQDEVLDLARQDMMESAGYVSRILDEPSGATGSSSKQAISGGKSSQPDVQAQIDDLRATIASARSLLQQMRQDQVPSSTNRR